MTPHDLELKRYNDIVQRLDQIENILYKIMDHTSYKKNHKVIDDGVHLSLVYLKDVKDLFRKYAERQHG